MILTFQADQLKPIATLHRRLKLLTKSVEYLQHVRLTLLPGQTEATIESTDLDIHITSRIPVGAATPGTFTLPRKEFFEVIRTADKGTEIRLESSGQQTNPAAPTTIAIASRSKKLATSLTLLGLDPTEFPISLHTAADWVGSRHILPSDTIRAIHTILPSASADETRYVLNGVFCDPAGAVIATDGRRLAHSAARVTTPPIILPSKLVSLFADKSIDSAAVANVHEDKTTIALAFGKTTICSKLITGNFPNYRQVMPKESAFSATITPTSSDSIIPWLRTAGKRAMKNNSVRIEIKDSTLRLSTKEPDHSESAVSIPVHISRRSELPNDFAISFNPTFLADGLALGLTTLDLIDGMSPGVLTNGTTRYVLMPMRVLHEVQEDQPEEEQEEEEPEQEQEQPAPADPNTIEVESTSTIAA